MSSATIPIIKTLAMADSSSLLTFPSIFTPNTPYSYLSVPQKSIKLRLSCSHSTVFTNSLSLKRDILFSPLVAFVAQTSDWAQQEEGQETQLVVELEEGINWENQEFDAFESPISDWEGEGEDAAIKASREEIGEGDEDGFSEEGEEEGEVYQESLEELKVFVGNLSYDVDSERLAQIFEQAGVVEISEVIFNRETNQSRGFGFVTMSTVEEAEKAVEMFNRYMLNGRPLTVNKAAPRGSRPERPPRSFEPSFRIYVGNLPWDVDNTRLEQIFSEHGKVVEARVVYDRETGRSRGFAFVTMSSQTEMNDAIAALDGESLDGRAIRVSAAGEGPRRSSF